MSKQTLPVSSIQNVLMEDLMKLDVILVQHVIKQRKDVSFNESEIEREFINTLLKRNR